MQRVGEPAPSGERLPEGQIATTGDEQWFLRLPLRDRINAIEARSYELDHASAIAMPRVDFQNQVVDAIEKVCGRLQYRLLSPLDVHLHQR